jgi:DNA-directed RNA polymerase subunit M
MIQFCPKCKAILMPKKIEGKLITQCSCGYIATNNSASISEKRIDAPKIQGGIADSDIETLPTTKEECPKCANTQAYYWLIQTRAGDEAETRFLKCTKCKHTWREYD